MAPTPDILVVADDTRERAALLALLRAEGYVCRSAATCEEALQRVREQAPAVALIDLWLADLPGHVVLHGLRQVSPATECIALMDSPAQQEGAREALKLGAYTCLRRSTDALPLLNMVTRALEKYGLERQLAEVKSRLATLFEAIPAGVLIVDAQTRRVVDANPAAVQAMGGDRAELLRSSLNTRPIGGVAAALADAEGIAPPSGRVLPATRTAADLTIGGRPHRLECFVDVTGRLAVEDRLAVADAALELLGATADGLILAVDRDGRLLRRVSPPPATGETAEAGGPAVDLLPAGARDRFRQALREVLRTGEGAGYSGGTPPLESWTLRIVPVVRQDTVVAVIAGVRDFDPDAQAAWRRALRAAVAEHGRTAWLAVNAAGQIVDGNAALRNLLGYLESELCGLTYAALDASEPPRRWGLLWSELNIKGRVDYASHYRGREGDRLPVRLTLRPARVDALPVAIVEVTPGPVS